MNLMERLKANSKPMPPRVVIYGTSKIGKTTFATNAPNCVVVPTEDGLVAIDENVMRFPLCQTYGEVLEHLDALLTEEHDRKAVVLDSLDWLEPLIWDHVCKQHNQASIEAFGYGKGYAFARDEWVKLLEKLDELRAKRMMMVILIGHHKLSRFDDPASEGYDRYSLKLHVAAQGKVMEWADIIGFANYQTNVISHDKGFNQTRSRAVGQGKRMLYLEERPSYVAGNRYPNLPAEMPLDFNTFISYF